MRESGRFPGSLADAPVGPPRGTRTERPLPRELGANPGTVHRAAHRLRNDGMLELRRRRGWQVTRPRVEDLEDVYRIRLLLEPRAIPLAVARLDDGTLDEL